MDIDIPTFPDWEFRADGSVVITLPDGSATWDNWFQSEPGSGRCGMSVHIPAPMVVRYPDDNLTVLD